MYRCVRCLAGHRFGLRARERGDVVAGVLRGPSGQRPEQRHHHDGGARRPHLRVRAGRSLAGDQGRRVAGGAGADPDGGFHQRTGPAGRRLRSRLRQQRLHLRLLHLAHAGGPQPPQPVHAGRRRGGCRQRGDADGSAGARPGAHSQRRRGPHRGGRQTLGLGGGELQRPQCPEPEHHPGQVAADQPRRQHPDRQPVLQPAHRRQPGHLGAGPAQPLHLRHPADHRAHPGQRRRGQAVRRDQRHRQGRQLRLARDGRPPRRPALRTAVLQPGLEPPGLHADRRCLLQPRRPRLPCRLCRQVLLRRPVRRVHQGAGPGHPPGGDVRHRPGDAGGPRRLRRRQAVLPQPRFGHRHRRGVAGVPRPRRPDHRRPARGHAGLERRAGELQLRRQRRGPAGVSVATRRRRRARGHRHPVVVRDRPVRRRRQLPLPGAQRVRTGGQQSGGAAGDRQPHAGRPHRHAGRGDALRRWNHSAVLRRRRGSRGRGAAGQRLHLGGGVRSRRSHPPGHRADRGEERQLRHRHHRRIVRQREVPDHPAGEGQGWPPARGPARRPAEADRDHRHQQLPRAGRCASTACRW